MSAALIPLLDWAAKNWKLLIWPVLALIVLAALLYGVHLCGKVDALTGQLAAAQAVNAGNRKEIATIRANAAASATAVATIAAVADTRAKAVATIKRDIYHAETSSGDCTTVGPRLGAALDGLRRIRAGDENPD